MTPRFEMGFLGITPGAQEAIPMEEVQEALHRHVTGDWGDVCKEDAQQNEWALKNDARLLSSYKSKDGEKFWIITEADRSSTTILLPSEY
ncbi:hypothetical protein [Crateriforma conspicua]|uniref:hypothetical protein n=1 Tax=Crateriforma conspicua TaxID=2527996 RepID=UPI0011893E58|nr:hypothetical protein [Crateriforma conspicua]QDV66094.1 hypothetical protein Mal65_52670 [Crateriforma conspicua]